MEFPNYDPNLTPLENLSSLLDTLKGEVNKKATTVDKREKLIGDRVIVTNFLYNKLIDGTLFKLESVDEKDLPYCSEGIVIEDNAEMECKVGIEYVSVPDRGIAYLKGTVVLNKLVHLNNGVDMYLPSDVLLRIDDSSM